MEEQTSNTAPESPIKLRILNWSEDRKKTHGTNGPIKIAQSKETGMTFAILDDFVFVHTNDSEAALEAASRGFEMIVLNGEPFVRAAEFIKINPDLANVLLDIANKLKAKV